MSESLRIAVDAMGGDFGPSVTVPAALRCLALHSGLEIILVGREDEIRREMLPVEASTGRRVSLRHCDQIVAMSDKPSLALRNKKNSSMRVAVDLVKSGEASACVSAGNTGALMAIGCYVLKTSAGIDRPAICVAMPTREGHSYLLDLGANVDSSAAQLHEFAHMGSILAAVIDGKARPRVALLNIGEEEIKGNEQVKRAAQLLSVDDSLHYVGYVEADHLFDGNSDVVVCDGFVGNVALKAAEGTARLVAYKAKRLVKQSLSARLLVWLARPVARRVLDDINPDRYNGAFFLGLQGVLVKSHGSAPIAGFQQAIEKAIVTVEKRLVQQVSSNLEAMSVRQCTQEKANQ